MIGHSLLFNYYIFLPFEKERKKDVATFFRLILSFMQSLCLAELFIRNKKYAL